MRNCRLAVQHQGTMKKNVFGLWLVLHMKCFWFAGPGAAELYVCMFGYVIPTVRCWLSPLSGVLYLSGWAELMRLSTFRELKARVQANTDQISLFSVLIRWPSTLPNTRTVCQWNRWSRTGFRTRGVPFSFTELFPVFSYKPEFLCLLPWFVTFPVPLMSLSSFCTQLPFVYLLFASWFIYRPFPHGLLGLW